MLLDNKVIYKVISMFDFSSSGCGRNSNVVFENRIEFLYNAYIMKQCP